MTSKFFVFVILIQLLCTLPIFSQDDFVLFTHYDQLTWSPKGDQIAFRCLLLDESNPDNIFVNVLIKDLKINQLTCINPKPERFVISKDKNSFLFSSVYGLFIQTIEPEPRAAQIIFKDPTANWFFKDFGFSEQSGEIYVERFDYLANQANKENYFIDLTELARPIDINQTIKKLNKVKKSKHFNLPVDGFFNKTRDSIRVRSYSLGFKKNKTKDFDLVLKDSDTTGKNVLIKNCRPRLLSLNPDRSFVIVSIFENNGHVTYLFNAETKKLKLIEKQRYFSVSWFDNLRYVCINDKGLFLREIDRQTNKKLDDWILPQWCQNIDLSFPKYELKVGFVEAKNEAVQKVEKLHQSHFPARMTFYKDKKRAGYGIRVGGFKTKQEAQLWGKKLKQEGYDYWIANIDNLFDFYNSEKLTERKSFNGKTARIEYQKEEFLRSRIVLINKEGTKKIIVDEMNNIPDRSHFKNLNH